MYTVPAETKAMTRDQLDEVMAKHGELGEELRASGEIRGGDGLDDPEETTTLRWGGGEHTRSTGPIADAEEHMSAYYVVDCADRDRALAIAERLLDFHVTAVEVRGIHDTVDL